MTRERAASIQKEPRVTAGSMERMVYKVNLDLMDFQVIKVYC